VHLNKQLGISRGNAAAVLGVGYGLQVCVGGLCRAVARLGKKTEPTYQAMVVAVRQAAGSRSFAVTDQSLAKIQPKQRA